MRISIRTTMGPMPDGADSATAVLEIDLSAIVSNWQYLCRQHPSGRVGAVVKADAYGLGAAAVAQALAKAGCETFFVATLAEAVALRRVLPRERIIALNGLAVGHEEAFVGHNIIPALASLPEVAAWRAMAHRANRRLPAVLHIDTGLSRLGLAREEFAALTADLSWLEDLELVLVMTHLVSAERPEDPMNARQREDFAAACAALPPVPRSFANSSGIFLGPDFGSDLARPGAALYGINPTPSRPNPMRHVVRLLARVLQVRNLPRGATVGYNATWRAERPSVIATLGIGYADGWPRVLSGRSAAFFDGRPALLVGRISMDLLCCDITELPPLRPGAWAELIGPNIPVDRVAEAAGTIAYELLTRIGPRVRRRELRA